MEFLLNFNKHKKTLEALLLNMLNYICGLLFCLLKLP